jgi:hypothetical protein
MLSRRRLRTTAVTLAVAPFFPWNYLLPGLPTSHNPQPSTSPGCPRLNVTCENYNIAKLSRIERKLGCDHRAVFVATYRLTTTTVRAAIRSRNPSFNDTRWLIAIDGLFHDYYFDSLSNYGAGKPVPKAWKIAFDAAASGDDNATKDLLLGVNAHVNRDLPYVLATEGLHTRSGASRKHDWDKFNIVLDRAYSPIVDFITAHYDSSLRFTNPNTVIDGEAGLQLFQVWREIAFRNAERLLNARTPTQRRRVERSIEAYSAGVAKTIEAVPDSAGYRAVRDQYCATHN